MKSKERAKDEEVNGGGGKGGKGYAPAPHGTLDSGASNDKALYK